MLRKPLLTLLLALLLAGGFAYGLVRLFMLRYEVGDIYPPYSSLRADPLGTRALAEALDDLPDVEMQRNFKPLPKLRAEHPVTLVYTGVPHRSVWTEPELAAFDSMVVTGSRAVFTFFPIASRPTAAEEKLDSEQERTKKKEKIEQEKPAARKKKSSEKKKPDEKKPDEKKPADKDSKDTDKDGSEKYFVDFNTVAKRWGFQFDYLPEEKKPSPRQPPPGSARPAFESGLMHHEKRQAALIEPGGHLETDIQWHSALCFRDLKPQWKVLYVCGTMPVVIERKYGAGSIVLVADSFFVSNEAMSKERHPKLLARLFSGPSPVIFDEESRGLRDNPGIASLARKYRLHGFFAGLFLLALFFVWKNAVRFIPAYEPQFAESDVVAGKDSQEGFVNLLRRSIRPSIVFETCVAEWRKAFVKKPREMAKVEEVWAEEQTRPARERDPVATYRAISRALVRKSSA